jgi:hypothetical protein
MKHLLLFKYADDKIYNKDVAGDMLVYGSYHMRKILLERGESTLELDRLVIDSAETRAELLNDLLQKPNILSKTLLSLREDIAKNGIESILLNTQLSPDLFAELLTYIRETDVKLTEESMRSFIEHIINFDEYLANWGLLPILIPTPGSQNMIGMEQDLANYVYTKVKKLQNDEKIDLSYKMNISTTTNPYIKILRKGTKLVRGYKNYRGYVDESRSYSWFGLEHMTKRLAIYAIPTAVEDKEQYFDKLGVKDNFMFDFLHDYCKAVGGVAVYQVKADMKLLDFSDIVTLRYVTNYMREQNAPEIVINAFVRNWQIKDDEFARNSVDVTDGIVADWLCREGFGGYLALGTKGLHDEVLICDVKSRLEFVDAYRLQDVANFHLCDWPYTDVNVYLHYW